MKNSKIPMSVLLFIIFMISFSLQAQEVLKPSRHVPEAVIKALNDQYPNAKNVEWYKRKNHCHEAELVVENTSISILFNNEGEVVNKKTEINYSEYPEQVKTALSTDYIGRGYKPLSYMRRVEKEKIIYETLLAKGRHLIVIKYDPMGKFISNVSLTKWYPVEIVSIN